MTNALLYPRAEERVSASIRRYCSQMHLCYLVTAKLVNLLQTNSVLKLASSLSYLHATFMFNEVM